MNLEKLRPREVKFNLNSTGREYYLRPINLDDEIWLQEEFGSDITKIFSEDSVDMVQLSRIIFHQIANTEDFLKQYVTIVDEDGLKSTENIGGCKLLHRMIVGMEDKLSIIEAFNKLMVQSRPELEENEVIEKKKSCLDGM